MDLNEETLTQALTQVRALISSAAEQRAAANVDPVISDDEREARLRKALDEILRFAAETHNPIAPWMDDMWFLMRRLDEARSR